MLTAEQRELVAAAVDGELSTTEARALRRLLETSAEARELHAKLRADSERVRILPQPQVAPPANLRNKIMARVAAITPAPQRTRTAPASPKTMPVPLVHPATPAAPPSRRLLPKWVPVAVAAGVLLCVTAGSFAFFKSQNSANQDTAKYPWSHILPAPQEPPTAVPSPNQVTPRVPAPNDPNAVAHIDLMPAPAPAISLPKEVVPEAVAIAPEPRPSQHDILGSRPLPPIPPFELIQVRVPFLRAVSELERDDIRQDLRDELTPPSAYRLDLFVRDTARGVDVFQSAAKSAGLTVFADAATLEKLKKRQLHAVVIYVESLTAEELTGLFSKVSTENKKFSPPVCDSLHATATVRSDEAELKAILGVDVGLYKRPTGSGGAGQGSHNLLDKDGNPKPVSAGTIDTVTKSLTTPPAKPGEKPAVLMTWQTTHPTIGRTLPQMSAELKQFLAKRGDRKLNAVPTIIVIRPVG